MQQGVSVILCCYNSAERLPATLEHLAKQETNENLDWEIIVVDNASTDDTAAKAQSIWKNAGTAIDCKVLREPRPGLGHARHAGIAAAKYEYIIFCDDDNWFGKGYVQQIAGMLANNDRIGVLGGRCEAISNIDIPFWFNTYQQFYAVGCQALYNGDVGERNYVYGAGMAFKKTVYTALLDAGFPSLLTDRTGESLVSGGDTEICYIHRLAGFQIWYDESLFFQHFMEVKRLEKKYLEKLMAGALEGIALLHPYIPLLKMGKTGLLKRFFLFIFYLLRSIPASLLPGKDPRFHLAYAEAYNPFPLSFHKEVKKIKKASLMFRQGYRNT